jgi:hypothetical protein
MMVKLSNLFVWVVAIGYFAFLGGFVGYDKLYSWLQQALHVVELK